VRLPNNIPIYGLKTGGSTVQMLKMDTSDRLVVGDGGEPIYLNADGTGVIVDDSVPIQSGWASKKTMLVCTSGGALTLGYGTANTTIEGVTVKIKGILFDAAAPTTSDFANGSWGMYRDTDAGKTYICANFGNTLYKAELT